MSKNKGLKIMLLFAYFPKNFGPFYAGPKSAILQKLTPLRTGVITANKVVVYRESVTAKCECIILFFKTFFCLLFLNDTNLQNLFHAKKNARKKLILAEIKFLKIIPLFTHFVEEPAVTFSLS